MNASFPHVRILLSDKISTLSAFPFTSYLVPRGNRLLHKVEDHARLMHSGLKVYGRKLHVGEGEERLVLFVYTSPMWSVR